MPATGVGAVRRPAVLCQGLHDGTADTMSDILTDEEWEYAFTRIRRPERYARNEDRTLRRHNAAQAALITELRDLIGDMLVGWSMTKTYGAASAAMNRICARARLLLGDTPKEER